MNFRFSRWCATRVVVMKIKLFFLNHTHPPLRATSFLREVNIANFFMDRHTGLHPVRDDVQMIFYKPFLPSP